MKMILTSLLLISQLAICQSRFDFKQRADTAPRKEAINVYFNCQTYGCDFDYIRQELKWVDFVRDRADADVHLLITSQHIDGGGEKYYLNFIGQDRFDGLTDTISYINKGNNTTDTRRKLMVQYIRLGLIRYVAKTTYANNVSVTYKIPDAAGEKKDPWNAWVFNIGMNGYFSGSETYSYSSFGVSATANRTTEKRKTNFYTAYDDRLSRSQFGTEVIKAKYRSFRVDAEEVYSISKHFSFGIEGSYSNSLFDNYKNRLRGFPKVEYSFFPYSVSNTKAITLAYFIGAEFNEYNDTTIYFKTKELLWKQVVNANTAFTQPWGYVYIGFYYSNYLDDFAKNNLGINGSMDIRLYKGLFFELNGNYSIIHDQVSLPKGTATRDDVLTQRRLLASTYNFYTGMGLRYRFGSEFNNVVNKRFSVLSY